MVLASTTFAVETVVVEPEGIAESRLDLGFRGAVGLAIDQN